MQFPFCFLLSAVWAGALGRGLPVSLKILELFILLPLCLPTSSLTMQGCDPLPKRPYGKPPDLSLQLSWWGTYSPPQTSIGKARDPGLAEGPPVLKLCSGDAWAFVLSLLEYPRQSAISPPDKTCL